VSNEISLDPFDCLHVRGDKETFFPHFLVRQEMKQIMKRLMLTQSEIKMKDENASQFDLLGSPGIGKSLLLKNLGELPILLMAPNTMMTKTIFCFFLINYVHQVAFRYHQMR
jgi:hypothetical protein